MLDVHWDEKAWKQVTTFLNAGSEWESQQKLLADELAKTAEEYFKPMLNVRAHRTGRTKESIRHEISHSGDGFEIEYHGLLSALYMDQGNFPASERLWAKEGTMFPIDMRFGSGFSFASSIHGMGYRTPGAPTQWSEKTADWLQDEKAIELALDNMWEFLNRVVIE